MNSEDMCNIRRRVAAAGALTERPDTDTGAGGGTILGAGLRLAARLTCVAIALRVNAIVVSVGRQILSPVRYVVQQLADHVRHLRRCQLG